MEYVVIVLCNIESFDIVSPRGHRPAKLQLPRSPRCSLVPRPNGGKAFLNMFYNYFGRFRFGDIANLDKIEQNRSEVMHFRKWSF